MKTMTFTQVREFLEKVEDSMGSLPFIIEVHDDHGMTWTVSISELRIENQE